MPWYVAESRERVIRLPNRVSRGVRCEGYETPVAGQVYMHLVELSPDDVASLRHRVEDGKTREQLALPGEGLWYISKNGKCRWPGTRLHSRAKKDATGRWQPVPVDDEIARRLLQSGSTREDNTASTPRQEAEDSDLSPNPMPLGTPEDEMDDYYALKGIEQGGAAYLTDKKKASQPKPEAPHD